MSSVLTGGLGYAPWSLVLRGLLGGSGTTPAPLAVGPPSVGVTSSSTAAVNSAAASGGTSPYAYQAQIAPDAGGTPGTWASLGSPQALAAGLLPATVPATSLTAGTRYWFAVQVTDSVSTVVTSPAASVMTWTGSAAPKRPKWWGRRR